MIRMLERIRKGHIEELLLGDKRREREKKIEGRGDSLERVSMFTTIAHNQNLWHLTKKRARPPPYRCSSSVSALSTAPVIVSPTTFGQARIYRVLADRRQKTRYTFQRSRPAVKRST